MKNRCSQKWLFLAYLFFECRYLTCMSLQTLHHKKSLIGYSQCLMSYSHSATSIDKSTIQRVCNATSYHYMVLMILTIHVKFLITTIEIWVDVKFLTFFYSKTYYRMILYIYNHMNVIFLINLIRPLKYTFITHLRTSNTPTSFEGSCWWTHPRAFNTYFLYMNTLGTSLQLRSFLETSCYSCFPYSTT